ncbi:MFS transporter [Sphaerisporangium sp. NPDC005288]|uniref:MFS transporter n=1 Tax=Sphaerisporangium sp. NPDC005288 TaxID=3155114 RepID=UPI00339DBBAD
MPFSDPATRTGPSRMGAGIPSSDTAVAGPGMPGSGAPGAGARPAGARTTPPPASNARRWISLVVVCLGMMMAFFNISATLTALTEIQADLQASATTTVWITSAYSLLVASLVLSAGTIGDRLGHRRTFFTGALVFTAGSALAFASSGAAALILAQAVMGVGGAIILPTSLSTVSHTFTRPHERTAAIGVWASCSGLGLAIGPVTAGLLLASFPWHAVYLLNVVTGALVLALTFPLVIPTGGVARRLDVAGLALGTLTVGALVFTIIQGGSAGYTSPAIIAGYVLIALALAGFVAVELRAAQPMVDVRLFRSASFSAVLVSATASLFGFTGIALLNVLYLQRVQGRTPLTAGVFLMVMFVTYIVVSALAPPLVKRVGFRITLTAGLVLGAAGALLLLLSPPSAGFGPVWPGLLLFGAGTGLLVAPSTAAAVISVPHERAGMASAIVNMFRQLGSVLGASVLGTVLTSRFAAGLPARLDAAGVPAEVSRQVIQAAANGASGRPPAGLAVPIHHAIAGALTAAAHTGFVVVAAAFLVVALPTVLLVRHRPAPATPAAR